MILTFPLDCDSINMYVLNSFQSMPPSLLASICMKRRAICSCVIEPSLLMMLPNASMNSGMSRLPPPSRSALSNLSLRARI